MSSRECNDLDALMGSPCLENMRELANCIHEGVCAIDENGITIIWNESAEKIYNLPASEILDKPLRDFFPNALLDKVRMTRQAEANVSHQPREGAHILISARPLYIQGVFRGVVSTDRDYAEVTGLYADLESTRAKLSFLQSEIKKTSGVFGSIIGQDPGFLKKVNQATQIAPTHTNVMITGESGTGKEVFARGIHELSGREGLFVPINCSAIPSELFESEFFGYAPGAFTGASRKGKAGFFELANGGTIFLDEVSEMPFTAQAKLLRVLQEREVVRVGGERATKLDVRVISASNKNLKEMMFQEKFREDLYYRLNVVEIALPPLRERKADIPLLIEHFVREFSRRNNKQVSSVQTAVINLLCSYSWPGNVRQLMNVLENLAVTCQGGTIEMGDIPEYLLANLATEKERDPATTLNLGAATRNLESEKIRNALDLCRNNKSKAAKMLGIPRATLYNKMDEYDIPR